MLPPQKRKTKRYVRCPRWALGSPVVRRLDGEVRKIQTLPTRQNVALGKCGSKEGMKKIRREDIKAVIIIALIAVVVVDMVVVAAVVVWQCPIALLVTRHEDGMYNAFSSTCSTAADTRSVCHSQSTLHRGRLSGLPQPCTRDRNCAHVRNRTPIAWSYVILH
jgi:hypothetical protein